MFESPVHEYARLWASYHAVPPVSPSLRPAASVHLGAAVLRRANLSARPRGSSASPTRSPMSYENIIVETRGKVGFVRLNRPQALNALNAALLGELGAAVDAFEADARLAHTVI